LKVAITRQAKPPLVPEAPVRDEWMDRCAGTILRGAAFVPKLACMKRLTAGPGPGKGAC